MLMISGSEKGRRKAQALISRRTVLATLPAFLVASQVKAQGTPTAGKQRKGQVLVGWSQEPTVFNPLMPRLEVDQGIWFALFNPLWRADPDGSFAPELASEVPSLENGGISADGLAWTVKLRKDVKWHDGKDFTADDVKYTLDLLANPSFKAYTRQGHSLVYDIKIADPYTISWKMKRAYAPYLALLTWTFMVPKHALGAAADPNTAPFNSAPIGTGPFKWVDRVAGESVTLEANAEYFGEGPEIGKVVFNYIPDLNVGYTQFKTGQIDYIGYSGIPTQYYKEAVKLPDKKIHVAELAQIESLVLNFGNPILRDKAVRQAIYNCLNKKGIIDIVYYGLTNTTESVTPRASWAYNGDLPKQTFSIAAANSTLEEAGWLKGADGVRAKNGERLEFTTATVSGNPQRQQILQLLQQDLRKAGIAVNIKTMPAAVIYSDYYTKSQFDCLLLATTYGTGADPDLTQRFSSAAIPIQGGSGLNFYQYKNAEVDRLLEIAQTSFSRPERAATYKKIQAILRDDLAILPICQSTVLEGTKSKLLGYEPNANVSINTWNIHAWRWTT